MGKCVFRDGSIIENYSFPYFVAEVNTSHFGNIERAKEMIERAADIGCNCVKFQSWSARSLYSQTYFDENPFSERMMNRFVFNEGQLRELAEYCKQKKVSFASTPYCEREVDFLVDELKVPFIKIASMDLNNKYFLQYVAAKKVPIVLSTGMSSYEEVKKAVDIIREYNETDLCLLHCISVYPPKMQDVQLNNILGLREIFPEIPIGFSDHSQGTELSVAAIALGSCLIEKHLTLDKTKVGMDNQMAMEPEEFGNLIKQTQNAYLAMGGKTRIIKEEEIIQKEKMRRSVVAKCDIKKGTRLEREMLTAKRPEIGIPLDRMDEMVGKVLRQDITKDHIIFEQDVEW